MAVDFFQLSAAWEEVMSTRKEGRLSHSHCHVTVTIMRLTTSGGHTMALTRV